MRSQARQRTVLGLRCDLEGQCLEWALHPGLTTVGSLPDNDVTIVAAQVSRHHAKLSWRNSRLVVEDAGSTNGTYVNGVRVRKAELKVGDSVCFGSIVTFLEELDPNDASPALLLDHETHEQAQSADHAPVPTTKGDPGRVPIAWLGVVRHLAEAVRPNATTTIVTSLEYVRSILGAQALLQLRFSVDGEPELERITGDCPDGGPLERLCKRIEAESTTRTHRGLIRTFVVDSSPLAVAATAVRESNTVLALAAIGDLPEPILSAHLLAECIQLLPMTEPQPRARHTSGTITGRNLIFPPWYVPGASALMTALYQQLGQLVAGDLPILITGETGVGKEAIARTIHLSSERNQGPFVAVNCAAIPSELLETELFGIDKGVATGVEARKGKMVSANGGVLLLDEISEMSPALQAKLLRALQESEVYPVGARRPVALDVRVVSATNTDLPTRMGQGLFRRDLYYRLAGCVVEVPPLRRRPGDIPSLVHHFLKNAEEELGKRIRGISVSALRDLMAADWPGNIRELEHEVRRLVYLCPEDQLITSRLLAPRLRLPSDAPGSPNEYDVSDLSLASRLQALERDLIVRALAEADGNRTRAAKLLGVSRYGLHLKMRRLGLERWDADTTTSEKDG